jgi:hypothetical protein
LNASRAVVRFPYSQLSSHAWVMTGTGRPISHQMLRVFCERDRRRSRCRSALDPGRRLRTRGSKLQPRSRGVWISTRPCSVINVFGIDPLRVLPAPPVAWSTATATRPDRRSPLQSWLRPATRPQPRLGACGGLIRHLIQDPRRGRRRLSPPALTLYRDIPDGRRTGECPSFCVCGSYVGGCRLLGACGCPGTALGVGHGGSE